MDFSSYNEIVRQWADGVMENHTRNAELTLKYCNDLIEYGTKLDDMKLMGFGYYYISETYYCLNDGDHFFDTISKALSYLDQAQEWELVARSYNVLGITAMNRGNAPIALDYYLNGISYCQEYDIPEVEVILNINCGALNQECGRFQDALKYLEKAYAYVKQHPESPIYHRYMICVYQNIASCKVMQNRFDDVEELYEVIHRVHWPYADYLDKIAVLCSEAMYYQKIGDIESRDDCIEQVDCRISDSLTLMDMFDDYYNYCELLLECDKDKEFWHFIDILEPMIRSFNITNMQLMEISLKIKYYRKHHKNAEYLQAAGLYYELSERKEEETQKMINNVLNLRKSLEMANRVRQEVEVQNQILAAKSETDQLTKLANRFKLNDYADMAFSRAYSNDEPFAIEILDIDYFKEFNDNYGHQMGDICLSQIAEILRTMEEEHGAFCARYGGDEFILLYENTDKLTAVHYAEELKRKVMDMAMEHKYSKALPIVTISQGICCDVPVKGNRVWDFLHVADDMLYQIKKKSRNNFCVGDMQGEENIVGG